MKTEVSIVQMLRWRLALAEASAPPPPAATRFLERVSRRKDEDSGGEGVDKPLRMVEALVRLKDKAPRPV